MVLLPNDTVTLYNVLRTIMVSTVAGNCTGVAAYHISLCLVHRLQFNRIENIWLDCAFQILWQNTNLFAESIILPDSFQLTSFWISGNKANKLSRSFRFRKLNLRLLRCHFTCLFVGNGAIVPRMIAYTYALYGHQGTSVLWAHRPLVAPWQIAL